MEKKKFIVTVNREYGTGGKTIAHIIGESLGVKVYDKTILDHLAEEYNMTDEEMEQLKAKKPHWWDDFTNFYRQFNSMNRKGAEETKHVTSLSIYHAESRIMRRLAEQESCIFVGRSAFHIFKDDPCAFKILFIANDEHRVNRIMEKYGVSRFEALKLMSETDEARENYTKIFARTSRYDARHYDLTYNVSGFTIDKIAADLTELIKRRFQL